MKEGCATTHDLKKNFEKTCGISRSSVPKELPKAQNVPPSLPTCLSERHQVLSVDALFGPIVGRRLFGMRRCQMQEALLTSLASD